MPSPPPEALQILLNPGADSLLLIDLLDLKCVPASPAPHILAHLARESIDDTLLAALEPEEVPQA
eukprot:14209358-Alexandrium_andersonii.AAC.1